MASDTLNPALRSLDPVALQRLATVASRLLGAPVSLRSGDRPRKALAGAGIEFLDHRAYAAGDDVRHVDWRASARHGTPVTRRFRLEASSDWHLCVDRSASMMIGDGAKWWLACRLGAALAYVLLSAGHRVSLLAFSRRVDVGVPLARGHRQYPRILRGLAAATPASRGGGSRPGCCAAQIRNGGSAILVSDFLTGEAPAALFAPIESVVSAVHALRITGQRDTSAPTPARLRLTSVESGRTISASVSKKSLENARLELASLGRDIGRFCRARGIVFTDCRADADWSSVLVSHLQRTADRRA